MNAAATGEPYQPLMWIDRSGNKLAMVGGASTFLEAMKNIPFIVHMGLNISTTSVELADIILPTAEWLETAYGADRCNTWFIRRDVVHLFERECSVQRRHQKLIEESPSAFVTPELREKMTSAAVALAKRVGYRNAGTIEFLVDNDRNFYFCEMNTRIQVEHPVTEEVTGVDLVCEQLRVAAGEPLSFKQEDLTIRGHAIECRINAEDPSRNFAPCPGTLVSLHLPGGPGVRVDSAAYQGYKIPPFYDSMIGKLIVYGADREQAIVRMRRALAEMLFEGVVTATDYQMHILCSKAFVEANFNVNSIANGDFD